MDISKSTGLDGIGPVLLKLASGAITKSITYIAKKGTLQGNFPASWKRARINPLHKGGAKYDINNYRQFLLCQPYQNCSSNLFKLNLQPF